MKLSLVAALAALTGTTEARVNISGVLKKEKDEEKPRGPIGPTVVLLDVAD